MSYLVVVSGADADTIRRYTEGGCVFLAHTLQHNHGLPTISLGHGTHYANAVGSKYVVDIFGVWD